MKEQASLEIRYELELPQFSIPFVDDIASFTNRVFTNVAQDYVTWRLKHMPNLSVFCALDGDELIGFKAGYAVTQTKYYSWLGGVLPGYRRNGVASALMAKQHEWLANCGYQSIETAVNQENIAMAQVNLGSGFEVCGVRTEPHRVQVIFSKQLR